MFKAPQKPLRSSWRSEVFKKSTSKATKVSYSLGTRKNAVAVYRGDVLKAGNSINSNVY